MLETEEVTIRVTCIFIPLEPPPRGDLGGGATKARLRKHGISGSVPNRTKEAGRHVNHVIGNAMAFA